jgi:hypothetical protein
LKEKEKSINEAAAMELNRAMQRREEYSKSLAAAALGSRRDLRGRQRRESSKSKPTSSHQHDPTSKRKAAVEAQ